MSSFNMNKNVSDLTFFGVGKGNNVLIHHLIQVHTLIYNLKSQKF